MSKRHPDNERIKLVYFEYLKQADGKAEQTVRQIEKAILRFEEFTGFVCFKTFDQKQAVNFKERMSSKDFAPATVLSTIRALKRFLGWLALQQAYKSRVKLSAIDYLNLSERDIRAANAPADKKFPTLEMIRKVITIMPDEDPIERRDQALIAFLAITGIRDGALVTLRLKHFDPVRKLILQNPREVATKFRKRIDTFLFPIDDVLEEIFLNWVQYLRQDQLFVDDDPLFPQTAMGHDENDCFTPTGVSREPWADASPVRAIFKRAFEAADLPIFTPHSVRKMIVSEMYARGLSVSQFKAWSQNLGHEGAMTTLTSYGKLSLEEQERLVRVRHAIEDEQPLTGSQLEKILKKHGL